MKIFFSSIVFFLAFFNAAYAQTQQGQFVVSGATDVKLLLSNQDPSSINGQYNNVKSENFEINAGLGYFLVDNLAVHLTGVFEYKYDKKELNFGSVPSDDPVYEKNILSQISVIPSISYFFPVEGKLRPNIRLGAGYTSLRKRDNEVSTPDNVVYHYSGLSLNIGAGLAFFLNESVSLDLGFRYQRSKLKDKANEHISLLQKEYGLMTGVSVYF